MKIKTTEKFTKETTEPTNWILKKCKSPSHEPPAHISLRPGVYTHTCPQCKECIQFIVMPQGTLDSSRQPITPPVYCEEIPRPQLAVI